MSATDYRQLIDIHGNEYIGIECVDGMHVDIGVSGRFSFQLTVMQCAQLEHRLRQALDLTMPSAFDVHAFNLGGSVIEMNYYDLGTLLDSIAGARRVIIG